MSVPRILEEAWNVCTPGEHPLREQVAPLERTFLIKFAEYVSEMYPSDNMSPVAKENIINQILETAHARIAVLAKEVTPSLTHAVMAVVLYLLSNILTNDHVKYRTLEDMLKVYPLFLERSDSDKQNLFLTANWMNILFRVIPARKNKGIAMDIVPKFVEGNGANYVTGGGQTQSTRDRVFIYETEGGCKPIKRLKRKSKSKLLEEEAALQKDTEVKESTEKEAEQQKKKRARPAKSNSLSSSASDSSDQSLYFSLLAPFYQAQPLPIPAISPRSQSSFSQAAAVIANFGQTLPPISTVFSSDTKTSNEEQEEPSKSSFLVSPRECYIDIEEDGTVVKKLNPRMRLDESKFDSSKNGVHPQGPPSLTSSVSRFSSSTSTFDKFVDSIGNVDVEAVGDQLAMLREASADSDI